MLHLQDFLEDDIPIRRVQRAGTIGGTATPKVTENFCYK